MDGWCSSSCFRKISPIYFVVCFISLVQFRIFVKYCKSLAGLGQGRSSQYFEGEKGVCMEEIILNFKEGICRLVEYGNPWT